jgi:hypothetical protein
VLEASGALRGRQASVCPFVPPGDIRQQSGAVWVPWSETRVVESKGVMTAGNWHDAAEPGRALVEKLKRTR